ncbi:hypothetical protein F0U62_08290 [Cystobacter fuscus]|uniref:hypothetical protein n=1 Tax=Cystobacter fuscus TaxID=43 RepID=UPI002B294008|nr:hypothetical protein F0U62_08290 [Cystobacter fuscus]
MKTTASTSGREQGQSKSGGERELILKLEERFRHLTHLLYDTRIPEHVLDEELAPYLAEDIRFIDPWQTGAGRETYRRGAAGFHCMFRFDFDIFQLNVQLEPGHEKGRVLVDGTMNLRQFDWLYVYPLRTFLAYDFSLERPYTGGEPHPLIHRHEEMWSLGDMIEAVPGVGWVYKTLFRPGFSYGFLAASALCRRNKQRSAV